MHADWVLAGGVNQRHFHQLRAERSAESSPSEVREELPAAEKFSGIAQAVDGLWWAISTNVGKDKVHGRLSACVDHKVKVKVRVTVMMGDKMNFLRAGEH